MERSDEVQALMRKARRALYSGRLLLENDYPDGAASRLYYAVFDAARAALLARGETPKTHAGVRRRFGFHFGRPGSEALPSPVVQTLTALEQARTLADYDVSVGLTKEDVEPLLPQAERFVRAVADRLDA
jgi:uncharacterized protein (UPF0332 family)